MESFKLQVDQKTYKVIRCDASSTMFSVFNHSSFHTIVKVHNDYWEVIEHHFGDHQIPLQQIGKGIEDYWHV
jgi:hypothetical protein